MKARSARVFIIGSPLSDGSIQLGWCGRHVPREVVAPFVAG
jgi:hypothetical protein